MPLPSVDTTPSEPAAPLVVGLTLSSTAHSGKGPRLGIGNTLMGAPSRTASAPVAGSMARGEVTQPGDGAPAGDGKGPTPAALQTRVTPHYPPAAKRDGVEGVVVLFITINEKGRVDSARVLRGIGSGLDESALDAARTTTWFPATIDGQPVRSTRRFNVRFSLHI
jgi:protein TonB